MQGINFYTVNFSDLMTKYTPSFMREYSFVIKDGDFLQEDTTRQESELILIAKKGQFYFEPFIGYDIGRLQNSRPDKVTEKGKIIQEFSKDSIFIKGPLLMGKKNDPEIFNNLSPEDLSGIPDNMIVILYEPVRNGN